MPTTVVKTPDEERLWTKAKALAAKKFPTGSDAYWAYVHGIFKKMTHTEAAELVTPEVLDYIERYAPELLDAMLERRGRKPVRSKRPWMEVEKYFEWKTNSEMIMRLRNRRYWFPLTPKVADRFIQIRDSVNRGAALRYLQRYIRRYRHYKGLWSKRYYERNRIKHYPGNIPVMTDFATTRFRFKGGLI